MNKYEFKLTFETDIQEVPSLLVEVVKVLEDQLKGKVQNIKPTFTILNNKKFEEMEGVNNK
ncbi:MAG TPA: hypothetical protein GX708_24720 [Gallicola sp.]|nr:hypothetical protein [Gallicola sp.]